MTVETRFVVVGSVSSKSGNSGGRSWTRYVLLDDDDKVVGSTFDAALGKSLADFSGKTVEVDVDVKDGERGKLYDLKAVRLARVDAGTREPQVAGPSAAVKHSTIVREVALKAAVDYVTILSGEDKANVDETLLIADKFVAYIEKGEA